MVPERGSEPDTLSLSPDPEVGQLGDLGPIKGHFVLSFSTCKMRIMVLIRPSHCARRAHVWSRGAGLAPAQRVAEMTLMPTHATHTTHGLSMGVHMCGHLSAWPCVCVPMCVTLGIYLGSRMNVVPVSVREHAHLSLCPCRHGSIHPATLPICTCPFFEKQTNTQHFLQFNKKKSKQPN